MRRTDLHWVTLVAAGIALSGCMAAKPATPVRSAESAPVLVTSTLLVDAGPSPFAGPQWKTEFGRSAVAWAEITSGGPSKDGIPAIDEPMFESLEKASAWISEGDPLLVVEVGDEVRAYPLAILIWHEIVNDTIDGRPIAVTYCPLCNSGIVFDATLDGRRLDFGTTGNLRNSDMIMYDRQTESWWQQFTGDAIVGELTGAQLSVLASQILSLADLREVHPEAQVLRRPAAPRDYGRNPYVNYDSLAGRPFLFGGELDERLLPMERIVGVFDGKVALAYPFATLSESGVVNDFVGETPIVVLFTEGVRSALDASLISEGRETGAAAVFERVVDGAELSFVASGDGKFTDEETGSIWNIVGEAVAGPLEGERLKQIPSADHFWFAWVAFHPDTDIGE